MKSGAEKMDIRREIIENIEVLPESELKTVKILVNSLRPITRSEKELSARAYQAAARMRNQAKKMKLSEKDVAYEVKATRKAKRREVGS
jgi:hypothetical protein